MEDTYGDMHSKRGITWKGIILRRRDKIKELAIGVEVSMAYAIGKNLEQYQKENDQAKSATTILETTLSQLRRKNLDHMKKSKKRSRVKRRRFRVISNIIICMMSRLICMNINLYKILCRCMIMNFDLICNG